MGILERARQLFGFNRPRLTEVPDRVVEVIVDTLDVHTANFSPDTDEKLVIVTTNAFVLTELSRIDDPVTLTHATDRPVTFVPVKRTAVPVLDPNHGWLIPVTPDTAEELAALPDGPGEHEFSSLHLGLILV